jgi:PAS domain S-box-containing protein
MLVTVAIRNISVRKAAAQQLARMEARYRGLLEGAPDPMVALNEAGEIVFLNLQTRRQFGYSVDELEGRPVDIIIPDGFAERLAADPLRPMEGGPVQPMAAGIELTGRRKNGELFAIEIMLSPLQCAEGMLMLVAIRDITWRREAERERLDRIEELNRSNDELRQFAYVASHDLQEPLRMVSSFTQLLAKKYKGHLDAEADEFIAFAVDGANRMQQLIQDLLAFSRVGTKGRGLLATPSEQALRRALVNLRAAMEESGAAVTHGPLPVVLADEMQLVQLFQNLVGNGIKYRGRAAPQVHVSAMRDGPEGWIFSVEDNGLGIEAQYFDRIFGLFQRLHTRDEFTGTGIGLAICKKIVERHGGTITVASQPGRGSTFSFTLAGSDGPS